MKIAKASEILSAIEAQVKDDMKQYGNRLSEREYDRIYFTRVDHLVQLVAALHR